MLTEHQMETFKTKGLLRLEKFLPVEVVRSAQEFIYGLAEKEGAWRDGTWQLDETSDRPEFTKPISKEEFNILKTPELLAAMSILVDGQMLDPGEKPSLLFSLPRTKMRTAWHTDSCRQPHGGIPGVQMFTFLETVAPGAGGTLVVSGSHRLVNDEGYMRSKKIRKRLKKYDYFRALFSRKQPDLEEFLTTPGKAEDVELQVVELHGEPGDVVLTDLRILHTGPVHIGDRPRLMVTERFHIESSIYF